MLDDNQSKIDASVMLLGSHTWQAVIQDARTFVGSRKIDFQPSLASGQAFRKAYASSYELMHIYHTTKSKDTQRSSNVWRCIALIQNPHSLMTKS